jgi:hypothetical protein
MEAEIRAGIGECEAQENNLARAVALGQSVGADQCSESGTCGEKGSIEDRSGALAEPVSN